MLSKLDVINDMIVSTGAVALNTEQARHPLYMKAERKLTRVLGAVCGLGLYFNTEVRYVEPSDDGQLYVPDGVIKADPKDRHINLTLRGRKLWDLDAGNWYRGGKVLLRMVYTLDFEEVPAVVQQYIAAKAVYEFYLDEDGADPKLRAYRQEQSTCWNLMWREHTLNRQVNVYDNPHNTINALRRNKVGGYPNRRFF